MELATDELASRPRALRRAVEDGEIVTLRRYKTAYAAVVPIDQWERALAALKREEQEREIPA